MTGWYCAQIEMCPEGALSLSPGIEDPRVKEAEPYPSTGDSRSERLFFLGSVTENGHNPHGVGGRDRLNHLKLSGQDRVFSI